MNDIINKVDKILKSEEKLSDDFGELSKIYLMTTENIKGFLERYSPQDKEVLTVAGSGDQMLNAYLMGAKNVTCFDINPLAFYQVNLKKAAVCTLTYEEYLEFFFTEFNNLLERDYFEKLSNNLDQETLEFFNYLYSNYNNKEIFDKVYYRFKPSLSKMKRLNAYLEKDNYEKLADILKEKEVSFIQSDITNLKSNLDNKYDLMLFSNISDSIEDIWPEESLKNFKRLIHSLSKNLNNNGIIQVGYIYDYYYTKQKSIFSKKNERQKVFTSDEFHTTFLESYRFHSESDAAITYQKIKRK